MNTAVIIAILVIYMGFMLYIGWRGQKYAKTTKDFLTAGKRGTIRLNAGSYLGGHVGTGIVIGGATYGATVGIGGAWYGLSCAFAYMLFAFVTARWAYDNNYLTIPQYLRKRFPDTGKAMTAVWSCLGACVAITTLCGQIIAGRALFTYLGIDPTIGSIISVVVLCLYCSAAGMFGVIATDFWQSVIILGGLVFAMFFCLGNGGWSMTTSTLGSDFMNFMPFSAEAWLLMTLPTAIYGITNGASMQLTASAKDRKTAFWAPIVGAVAVAIFTMMPVMLGMYGAVAFPDADSSHIMFTVIMSLPTIVAGLMLAAIVAAVMSTCDTTVMTITTQIVFDLYGGVIAPAMGKNPDDKKMKKACSWMSWILMGIALLLAFGFNDIITVLSSGYTLWVAGGMVPFLFGRFWKKTTGVGALSSMFTGALFALLNMKGITHFPTSLFCLIPAAIVCVIVSLCTQKKEPAETKAE